LLIILAKDDIWPFWLFQRIRSKS